MVSNDLEVSVPQQVVMSIVQTQGGSVEAYDLDGNVQADRLAGRSAATASAATWKANRRRRDPAWAKSAAAVRCASGGGSIFIDSVGGAASCETAGGEISVAKPAGRCC